MNKGIGKRIQAELEQLRIASGGILYPAAVVSQARDMNSALHSQFEWDDNEAAKAYRLQQARQIIRAVQVSIKTDDRFVKVRAYVMLKDDGQGYHATVDVLNDADLALRALTQIENEIRRWKEQYANLASLSPFLIRVAIEVEEEKSRLATG